MDQNQENELATVQFRVGEQFDLKTWLTVTIHSFPEVSCQASSQAWKSLLNQKLCVHLCKSLKYRMLWETVEGIANRRKVFSVQWQELCHTLSSRGLEHSLCILLPTSVVSWVCPLAGVLAALLDDPSAALADTIWEGNLVRNHFFYCTRAAVVKGDCLQWNGTLQCLSCDTCSYVWAKQTKKIRKESPVIVVFISVIQPFCMLLFLLTLTCGASL